MNKRTRDLRAMHKALNSRDNLDWIYVSRKEKGKCLLSIVVYVDVTILGLEEYTKTIKKALRASNYNNSNVNNSTLIYTTAVFYNDINQNSNTNTYTNTGGLFRFGYERVY